MERNLRIATYNIHKARGVDGRVRPQRIVNVLRELEADIIGLQEVLSIGGQHREKDQAQYFAEELGMNHCVGKTRLLKGGVYGNVILTRFSIRNTTTYDLSVRRREERGCLRADVDVNDGVVHIFNLHLGTDYFERRTQAQKIVRSAVLHNPELSGPRIVMGDLNEWTFGLVTRMLQKHFRSADPATYLRRYKTFPVFLPLLPLDHIYFDASFQIERLTIHKTPVAMKASDHLPLVADLGLHAPAVI